jgi:hypothetical protein
MTADAYGYRVCATPSAKCHNRRSYGAIWGVTPPTIKISLGTHSASASAHCVSTLGNRATKRV